MPNPFENAIAQALKAATMATLRSVVYRRGADSVTFDAGVGRTEFEIESGDTLINRQETKDLLVEPISKLDFGAGAVEPATGDTFEVVEGSVTVTYEVRAPEPEPAWRFVDPFRTAYRIHGIKTGGGVTMADAQIDQIAAAIETFLGTVVV